MSVEDGLTGVSLRPARADDSELLFRIFAAMRDEEGASAGWADARREAFLRKQFEVQERHYRSHFPDADYCLILVDGAPVGRVYFQQRAIEYGIIDLTLFPNRRGRGIGTAVIRMLQDRARAVRLPLRIYVEGFNPARLLFERLGFTEVGQDGRYFHLEWLPENGNAPA